MKSTDAIVPRRQVLACHILVLTTQIDWIRTLSSLGCYANRAVENLNLCRTISQNTTENDISTTGYVFILHVLY